MYVYMYVFFWGGGGWELMAGCSLLFPGRWAYKRGGGGGGKGGYYWNFTVSVLI